MARKPQISLLETHLGYWLRMVSNHVSHAFSRKVAAADVTVAEWVVLRTLYPADGATPSRVADELKMTRGAISKLVDRLVAKDLVSRTVSKGDRRWQDVALTPKGRALVPRLAALADDNDAEFFGALSPQERATLERILRKIVRQREIESVPVD
ncbi:MAG: MarR family winged helix-turn-helix transcriptional regulator [Rhizomicrobium sp.]